MSSSNQNHFQWFDVPVSFDLDLARLRSKYLELQRQLHPDQSAGEETVDQNQVLLRNTQLNDAYDRLRDPVKRAIYLLELAGIEYDPDRQTQDDPIYLMQQLEIREELGELTADSPNLDTRLDEFRSLALAQLEQYSEEFRLALSKSKFSPEAELEPEHEAEPEAESKAEPDWQLASAAIGRMMFANKLTRDVNEREEQLLDL